MSCPQRGTPWVWGFSGIGCTGRGVPKARVTLGMGSPAAHRRVPEARVTPGVESGRPVHRYRPAWCRAHGNRAGLRARADALVPGARQFSPPPLRLRSRGLGAGGLSRLFHAPILSPSFASRAPRLRGQKTGMEWRLAKRSRLRARAVGKRGGAGRGSWPRFFQTEPGVL